MKTICILKDGRPFWSEIETYLKAANAIVLPMDLKSILRGSQDKRFDIILGGDRFFKEIAEIPQVAPKLVITERNITENRYRDIYLLKWPVDKDSFLELTSRLLYVSERRNFRTVITILLRAKNETCLGKSLNFSISGMAFKADKQLDVGDNLNISFFIPGADDRLSIDAEVMRKSTDPEGGFVYYGTRFLDVDRKTKEKLDGFIKKIK